MQKATCLLAAVLVVGLFAREMRAADEGGVAQWMADFAGNDAVKQEAAVEALLEHAAQAKPAIEDAIKKSDDAGLRARYQGVLDRMTQVTATLETTLGPIHVKLFAAQTPLTCANFINLARRGFFDGLAFHRVIDNFMIQGGCPEGNGMGTPGYSFEDEIVADLKHTKPGTLSMANAGKATNGSQFFITHIPTGWLDGKHTVFGEVLNKADMDVVNRIQKGHKIVRVRIFGDTSALEEQTKGRIAKFNAALDKNFGHKLKPLK